MRRRMTGQEQAQEALALLDEAKAHAARADKNNDPAWRAAYAAQATACAQMAAAKLQAARLALDVLALMPQMVELGESEIRQWRSVAGVR